MTIENDIPLNKGKNRFIISGELTLIVIIIINSLGVFLMLYSGFGIPAVSSVPYAFSEVIPNVSLGTCTYIFQCSLVLVLMILRKKFVAEYLFSFVVGFLFGKFMDIHALWIKHLPLNLLSYKIIYFIISYFLLAFGIALSNRCGLPIIPTDLFPRELNNITNIKYSRIKIAFDVSGLATTAIITLVFLGYIKGLGIGTVLTAFTLGKTISIIGDFIDKKFEFVPFIKQKLNFK